MDNSESANSLQVRGIFGKISTLYLDQGDVIPDHYFRMHSWSPTLAALLVSGIFPSSPSLPAEEDPFAFSPPLDHSFFLSSTIKSWRARRYLYILNSWCQRHSDKELVMPTVFMDWYDKNPVPPLDMYGQPLKTNVAVRPPNQTESPLHKTIHRIKGREDVLSKIIATCQRELGDSDEYQWVWEKLVEKAIQPNPPPPLCGYTKTNGVEYRREGRTHFLTKDALRKRLTPKARGIKKTKSPNI